MSRRARHDPTAAHRRPENCAESAPCGPGATAPGPCPYNADLSGEVASPLVARRNRTERLRRRRCCAPALATWLPCGPCGESCKRDDPPRFARPARRQNRRDWEKGATLPTPARPDSSGTRIGVITALVDVIPRHPGRARRYIRLTSSGSAGRDNHSGASPHPPACAFPPAPGARYGTRGLERLSLKTQSASPASPWP